jgi:hypothetical protein
VRLVTLRGRLVRVREGGRTLRTTRLRRRRDFEQWCDPKSRSREFASALTPPGPVLLIGSLAMPPSAAPKEQSGSGHSLQPPGCGPFSVYPE